VYLKDEEIKKMKEEIKKKDEEIKRKEEEKKEKDKKIIKLKEKKSPPQQENPKISSSPLITVNLVVNSEMKFIKPLDDIKIQGKMITFTKDKNIAQCSSTRLLARGL
jgi:lysyl-tRNA synthetase class I